MRSDYQYFQVSHFCIWQWVYINKKATEADYFNLALALQWLIDHLGVIEARVVVSFYQDSVALQYLLYKSMVGLANFGGHGGKYALMKL